MPKNETLIAYLDHCAKSRPVKPIDESDEHYFERFERGDALWNAALADGWTIKELDEAYYRRFGYRMKR